MAVVERNDILHILAARVQRAREDRDLASAHYDDVMKELPSRVPFPDNVDRIRRASKEYGDALTNLTQALRDQTEFIRTGRLPKDLETPSDEREKP